MKCGIAVAATLALASPSQAAAGHIGIHFTGRNSANTAPASVLLPADSAGVVPQANWNNYDNFANGPAGTGVALNDDSGAATAVTLTFTGNDSWNNDDAAATATSAPNDKLMNGEVKRQGAGSAMTFTFANVPASSSGFYDVIVYTSSNNDGVRNDTKLGTKTFYTVGAHQYITGSAATAAAPGSLAIPARTLRQAKNEIDPQFGGVPDLGNYVKFAGVAPDSSGNIVITSTYISGGDGDGVNGIQLITNAGPPVDTTPPIPLITQIVPNNDYFLVTFSEALDATAGSGTHFVLNNGGTVTGATIVDPNNPTQVKVTVSGLTPNTAYAVTVTGIKDVAGNTFSGTLNFRTAARATGDITGFASTDGFAVNGGPTLANGVLKMTDGVNGETRSIFATNVVNINKFTAQYVYTGKGDADGFAFVVQGDPRGAAALGGGGGALGFVGVKNSIGLLINLYTGGTPKEPVGFKLSVDNTSGGYGGTSVNFASGHPILVTITYDQTTQNFHYYFLDLITTDQFDNVEAADIKGTVGGDYAYVGFTAATGGANSTQTVQSFRFTTADAGLANIPVAIVSQPQNTRVLFNTMAHFEVGVNQPATFQWFRGATPIDGATSAFLDVGPVVDADDQVKFHVVVTGGAGTTGNTVTSADATLKVGHLTFLPGYLKNERYNITDKAAVHNGTAGDPVFQTLRTIFFNPDLGGSVENFVDKTYGYVVPAVEGDYTFYLSLDDDGELYLSTDETTANIRMIARETQWSSANAWNNVGDATQNANPANNTIRRSDLFQQAYDGTGIAYATPLASPVPIHLKANTKYYIEMIHHEGGGGDNSGVTWAKFGDPSPADGTASVLTGNLIGADVLTGDTVNFTLQPANQTVTAGAKATFNATLDNPIAFFQWQKAPAGSSTFADIPGATSATYTTDFLSLSDNGAKFRLNVTIPGSTGTSSVATLTVNPSLVAATITGAGSIGTKEFGIEFSSLIDASTVTSASFSVTGGTISSVKHVVVTDGTKPISTVKITLAADVTGTTVNVAVVGTALKDASGNVIGAASKSVTVNQFKHQDIGTLPGDPVNAGDAVGAGNGAFDVISGGSDIYNNADGFHFVYEKIKGDFDLHARVDYVLPVNNWSAGAVMVRESLNANSRQWHLKVTPPTSVATVDGGTGAGSFETNYRPTTGAAVGGWSGAGGDHSAAVYPGQYIRLTRTNTVLTAWRAHTATTPTDADWVQVQQMDVAVADAGGDDGQGNPIPGSLPESMYVGLATVSHNNSVGLQFITDVLYRDAALLGVVDNAGTVIQPSLTVTRNNNGSITIAWTGAGKLQSNTVIGTTTGWVDVPNGGTTGVTITVPATGNTFYRVQQTP